MREGKAEGDPRLFHDLRRKSTDEQVLCYAASTSDRLHPPADYEGPTGTCALKGTSVQVFGLASREAEKRVNTILGPDARPWWKPTTRAATRTCAYDAASGGRTTWGTYRITFDEEDTLSFVFEGGTFWLATSLFAPETVTVDLTTGRRVELDDLVVDEARFIDLARACLPLYREIVPARFTSGDDFANHFLDERGRVPLWVLVPGGIAPLASYGSKVESALTGSGPVVSFDALLRDGLLRESSAMKRLWSDARSLRAGAPACTTVYQRGGLFEAPD